jgi:hypothetical protein
LNRENREKIGKIDKNKINEKRGGGVFFSEASKKKIIKREYAPPSYEIYK